MFTFRVDPTSIRQILAAIAKLQAFESDIEDRSKPHEEIKEWMVTRWADNFVSQGGIYGGWAPNSADWPPPGGLLLNSGGTFASFTSQNEAGVVSKDATSWTFRNEGGGARGGPYPVSHHTGYPNPISGRRAIPARILWDVNGDDEEKARQIMEDYIVDRIRAHGLS